MPARPVPDLDRLQAQLGHQFRDPELLRLAVTHPSVAHELGNQLPHNQRLEFLGDAVLQLALTRELFDRFPQFDEGQLSKARAQLVNQTRLEAQSRALALGEQLILSRGEVQNGGRERPSILADTFEAVLGALYLDGGFEIARQFVLGRYADLIAGLATVPSLDNPKGELQELLQTTSTEAPQYQTLRHTGPDHEREFECAVYHLGAEISRGKGRSKKLAESDAARAALERLRLPPAVRPR